MPVLAFPGPVAPAPPGVTLEVPEGWESVPAGADLLRTRGTGSAGDAVEVAIAARTEDAGTTASSLVEELTEAAAPQGSEVEPVFVVELGGREWAGRNTSWDDAEGPVVEVALAARVDDGSDGPGRFVVATGRVRGPGLDADYDVLQSVLETLVVGEAT